MIRPQNARLRCPAGTRTASVEPGIADLSLSVTPALVTITKGSTQEIRVTLTNTGPRTARHVLVALSLPSGVTALYVVPSAGGQTAHGWLLDSLAAGGRATLDVRLRAADDVADGELSGAVAVSLSGLRDPTRASAPIALRIEPRPPEPEADLVVSLQAGSGIPTGRGEQEIWVNLYNRSDTVTIRGARASLSMSIGWDTYWVENGGSYDPATRTASWPAVDLAPDQSLTLRAHSVMTDAFPLEPPQTLTATATSDTPDPDPTNNRGSATVDLIDAEFGIGLQTSSATVAPGDTITLTVPVVNAGNDQVSAWVEVWLPPGLEPVSVPAGGIFRTEEHRVDWTFDDAAVALGEPEIVRFDVLVGNDLPVGESQIVADVQGFGMDADRTNNTATLSLARA